MISGKADCGLRYAVKKSGSGVGYCALSIKCGTRDEKGYHGGIAHFVEHTIFKGTSGKSASVISSYLDRLGGELNAFTTKEEIVIHATVLKEDLGKAASLLFELATAATFPEHEIQIEKGVVIDVVLHCFMSHSCLELCRVWLETGGRECWCHPGYLVSAKNTTLEPYYFG